MSSEGPMQKLSKNKRNSKKLCWSKARKFCALLCFYSACCLRSFQVFHAVCKATVCGK